MTVYVDNMYQSPMGEYRGMRMSHMIADTTDELLEMCDKIGVNRRWIQDAGSANEHFDIAYSKRQLAVEHGAIQITMRELAKIIRDRK
jgi:hypothetical protein